MKIFSPEFIESFTSTPLELFYLQRRGKIDTDADFHIPAKK